MTKAAPTGALTQLPPSPPPRLGPPAEALTTRSRTLLDDLEKLIVTEGFAAFTLADLARQLRCSLRAFYAIAPTRYDLLLVVVDRRMRRLGRRVREELADHDDPLARLHLVLTLEATAMQATSAQFRHDARALPEMIELILAHRRYGASMIHQILVEGMRQGRFRQVDPGLVVEFIDAAVSRLEQPRFADGADHRWSEYVEELSRFVEAGVLGR
ncbi:TetR/AcrR family transcriptional regulator [Nocardia sp. FBN12]|uniref:TetR/AcrR family transcriptional regulator n=1 Tax=Nocardia sp. FBN12 TaxID=3419766 RepID=UPI003CFD643E